VPCSAPPRGFTDTKLPWSDVINNNPCGGKVLQRAGWPDPLAGGAVGVWPLDDFGPSVCRGVVGGDGTYRASAVAPVFRVPGPRPGTFGVQLDPTIPVGGVDIPYQASQNVGDVFTLEGWVKPNFAQLNPIVVKAAEYAFLFTASRLRLSDQAPLTVVADSTSSVPNDGNWHHVACTKNGATVKFYIDGVDAGLTAGTPVTFGNTAGQLYIGGVPAWGYFQGSISGVAVYPTVLSAGQIAERSLGKDTSADSLCMFHYQMKYGQLAVQQPITVEP